MPPFPFRDQSPQIPPAEFLRNSPPLPAAAAKGAWAAFQKWARLETPSRYAKFWQEGEARRSKARQALDAWPNPFVNARKGEPYHIEFSLPCEIGRFQFSKSDLAAAGLTLAAGADGTLAVDGVPLQSGSFSIRLVCSWRGAIPGLPLLARALQFFVNADPRDLWEDIPSDQTAEYARPDLAFARLDSQIATMWAASRRGRSHAHRGSPRDDAFELGIHNGWQILALADGAGSAPFSRKGAELACAAAINAVKLRIHATPELDDLFAALPAKAVWQPDARKLAWNILPYAAFEARKAILNEAAAHGRKARAYATTLLLAMAKKFRGGWAIMSFQIGDGAMALLSGNSATLLAEPDEGDFGGQTRFVTMDEVFEASGLARRLRLDFRTGLEGLVLMTDGVADPYFSSSAAFADQEIWQRLWTELVRLSESANPENAFLDWLNFWAKGNHDDRTIALLRVKP